MNTAELCRVFGLGIALLVGTCRPLCGNPVAVYSWALQKGVHAPGVPIRAGPVRNGQIALLATGEGDYYGGSGTSYSHVLLIGPGSRTVWLPCGPDETCPIYNQYNPDVDGKRVKMFASAAFYPAGSSVYAIESGAWSGMSGAVLIRGTGRAYEGYNVWTDWRTHYFGGFQRVGYDGDQTFLLRSYPFEVAPDVWEFHLAEATAGSGISRSKHERPGQSFYATYGTTGTAWFLHDGTRASVSTYVNLRSNAEICTINHNVRTVIGAGVDSVLARLPGYSVAVGHTGLFVHRPEWRAGREIPMPDNAGHGDSSGGEYYAFNEGGDLVVKSYFGIDSGKHPLLYWPRGSAVSYELSFDPWTDDGAWGDNRNVSFTRGRKLLWYRGYSSTPARDTPAEFFLYEADLNRYDAVAGIFPVGTLVRGSDLQPAEPGVDAFQSIKLLGADEQVAYLKAYWSTADREGGTIFAVPVSGVHGELIEGIVRDKDEPDIRLPGVKVGLFRRPVDFEHDVPVQTLLTNMDGSFTFLNVPHNNGFSHGGWLLHVTPTFVVDELHPESIGGFYRGADVTVAAGDTDVVIELQASTELSAKNAKIDILKALAPQNYTPPENTAYDYLVTLVNKGDAITDAELESARRAAAAEQAVVAAGGHVRELLKKVSQNFASTVTDLVADTDILQSVAKRTRLSAAAGTVTNRPSIVALRKRALASTRKAAAARFLQTLIRAAAAQAETDENAATVGAVKRILLDTVNVVLIQDLSATPKYITESVVSYLMPKLFDGGEWSYCAVTKPSLDYSAQQFAAWATNHPATDEDMLRSDMKQVYWQVRGTQNLLADVDLRTTWAAGAAGIFDSLHDATENLGKVTMVIPGLQGIAGGLKTASKVSLGAKYVSHFFSLFDPLLMVFNFVPERVDDAVHYAFHDPQPARRHFVAPSARDGELAAAPPSPLTTTECADMKVALEATRDLLESGTTDDLADFLTQTDTGLNARIAQAGIAMNANIAKVLGAVPLAPDTPAPDPPFCRDAAPQLALLGLQAEAVADQLVLFLLMDVAGSFSSHTVPDYVAARGRLIEALTQTIHAADQAITEIQDLNAALGNSAFYRTVSVVAVSATSTSRGDGMISQVPATFQVTAIVRNLSSESVSNIAAQLVFPDDSLSVEVTGSDTVTLGGLAADDGINGREASRDTDQTTVTWTITFPDLPPGPGAAFRIALTESDGGPTTFFAVDRSGYIPVDPTVTDADSDGMPDVWEAQQNLNTGHDDAFEDADDDGVLNIDEYRNHTRADLADTDDDGLSDGEEMSAGNDGVQTDPLNPDTDGDGTDDSHDGAPLDPDTTDAVDPGPEPSVQVAPETVTLTPDAPSATFTVENGGGGALEWRIINGDEDLIQFEPMSGREGDVVTVRLAPTFATDAVSVEQRTLTAAIMDTAGATRDLHTLTITLSELGGRFDLVLEPGWNLFSIPLVPAVSGQALDLVRGAVGGQTVWEWNGTAYSPAAALLPGEAYWVWLGTPVREAVRITGIREANTHVPLKKGWGLVGALGESILIPPDGAVHSVLWRWDSGGAWYRPVQVTDPFVLGVGYWVFAFQDAEITFQANGR